MSSERKNRFSQTCCEFTDGQLNFFCIQHGYNCPDFVLVPDDDLTEFFAYAPNATYTAKYCSYCGADLIKTCVAIKK